MSGGPTTWFSGKSAPEDQRGPSVVLILGVVFAVYSPIGVVVALACYLMFNYYRISHKVLLGAAALYCVPYFAGIGFLSSASSALYDYNEPWRNLIGHLRDGDGGFGAWFSDNWWSWFASQIWLSLAFGLIFGAAWASWKWIRRPAWEDNERIPGPVHRLRRRRAIAEIATGINGPVDGATVGVDPFGVRIVQTEAEAAAHTLSAGASGSGKTTTMLIGIRDAIRRGEPVCVVDLKGGADVPEQLAEWANRYGRRFLHWSILSKNKPYTGPADGPAFYDPIGRGDPSRKKDLIIGAEKWENEYYKSVAENYLQIAFQIGELIPNTELDAFSDLTDLMDPKRLGMRAMALFLAAAKTPEGMQAVSVAKTKGEPIEWWKFTETVLDSYVREVLTVAGTYIIGLEETERSGVRGLAAKIQKLRGSTAGAWLRHDPEHGRDIDLRKVADEGWVVVFSLDSSNYEATSSQVGGLIIQDLKTLSSDLRNDPSPHPFHIYVDEFSSIGSDNILGLLNKARDARMPVTVSTQALADLTKADPAFLDQALGIVGAFVIHRANTAHDAEVFAGLTGMKKIYVKRYGVEMTSGMPGGIGTGSATGQGHIEQQEDYVVSPSAFQALKPGELVYVAKTGTARVIHPVTVIREDPDRIAQAVATGAMVLAPPAPRPELGPVSSSPFDRDSGVEEFPSPWPVMADAQVIEGEVVTAEQVPFAPIPLRQAMEAVAPVETGATETSLGTGPVAVGEIDLKQAPSRQDAAVKPPAQVDPVPGPTPTPTPAAPVPGPAAPVVERKPIIDPALFRGDVPSAPVAEPVRGPAPVAVEQDAGFAFGASDVEWESAGSSCDGESAAGVPVAPVTRPVVTVPPPRRLPLAPPPRPAASSESEAIVPTTKGQDDETEMYDKSEWDK